MNTREQADPVQAAIAVRMLPGTPTHPQYRPQPVQVSMTVPRLTIEPPEMPVLDSAIVEESVRAITIPVRTSAPAPSNEESRSPKLVSSVEYVREPVPRYPPQSRKLREQGLVMLKVLIDEKGVACSIEIESSSGYARLDHAAREAVSRASFRPYVEDGEPRRALVLIPIEFYLNRSSA